MSLGFVVFKVKWAPKGVSTVYRRRFAIESLYKIGNVFKPRTLFKNVTIVYFMLWYLSYSKTYGYTSRRNILRLSNEDLIQ
jgi:IS4 transposase